MLSWCRHQTLAGRFTEPMRLVGLPAKFSEQAKYDREKGYHPIRITFEAQNDPRDKELTEFWPENRIPVGFWDENDLDAEGKYNHELYEVDQVNPMVVHTSDSDNSENSDPEIEEVPDHIDGPLMDF